MILFTRRSYIVAFFQLLSFQNIYSQVEPLQIKEQFDEINNMSANHLSLFKTINGIDNVTQIPQFDGDDVLDYDQTLGDRFGYVWGSYLTMFKTTGDKAYLHHFISQTYFCQQFRNDLQNPTNHEGWWQIGRSLGDGFATGQEYWDGIIVWPMAEYCFKIWNDPVFMAIKDETLPTALALNIIDANKWPNTSIVTYEDYAEWLANKVNETFQWYFTDGHFNSTVGFYHKYEDNKVLQINQQSPFAAAMFYLGGYYSKVGNPLSSTYLTNSKIIANLYQGNVTVSFEDSNIFGPFCVYPVIPVFRSYADPSRNATVWYTNGWEPHRDIGEENCFSAKGYWEDISHGAQTLFFPSGVFDYQFEFWGEIIFSADDMQRFANTVSQLLYYEPGGNPNFYYSVNTGDNDCYICESPNEDNRKAALSWANLSFYDPSPTYPDQSVYDVLSDYYAITLDGISNSADDEIDDGNHYLGLAYLTQQQWEKECVNLELYNREVVYNQDFIVKNNIVVTPQTTDSHPFHHSGDKSYAYPEIVNDKFTIYENVTVNMVAGESITLMPGFTAKAGCDFTASINPSDCTDGKSFIISNSTSNSNFIRHNNFNQEKTTKSLVNLTANVDTDKKMVWLNSENTRDKNQRLIITDLTGRVIKTYDHLPLNVNTNEMPPACYIFCYTTINGRASQKVFVQ